MCVLEVQCVHNYVNMVQCCFCSCVHVIMALVCVCMVTCIRVLEVQCTCVLTPCNMAGVCVRDNESVVYMFKVCYVCNVWSSASQPGRGWHYLGIGASL